MLRRLLGTAALAVLASGIGAIGAQAEDSVRLAVIEPLSGPVAGVGRDVLEQHEFTANRINESGGVLGGRMIEIVGMDNAMNAEKTTQQVQAAIEDGIRFVSQGVGSNHALNIIKFLGKHNRRNPDKAIVYLNNAAVTTAFTEELCSFWHFRFDANVDQKVAGLVEQIANDESANKIYMINQNYAFGKSFQSAAHRLLKERAPNVELVGDELIVPFGKVNDFTPYIAKIQESGADTVLTGNWGPDLSRFAKAAASSGLDAQLYTIYGGIPTSISAIGAADYKKISIKQVTEFHENHDDIPSEVEEFASEYLSATGKSWYADRYRWEMLMFAEALDKAGTDDPLQVALALEGMTFDGPLGEVYMRKDDHQIQLPMVVSTATTDVPKTFVYGGKDFGFNFATDSVISRDAIELPTSCNMNRPS